VRVDLLCSEPGFQRLQVLDATKLSGQLHASRRASKQRAVHVEHVQDPHAHILGEEPLNSAASYTSEISRGFSRSSRRCGRCPG
jgi:hypothetical protein